MFIQSNFISSMSNQMGIAQARSLLLGEQVNESSINRKANVFLNVNDKAASASTSKITLREARSLLL